MKEVIKIYIALVVFVYLLFSFVLWQIDASRWEEDVRFLFAYLLVLLPGVANLIYNLNKMNEK
jgi:hypothetical protein